MFTNRLSTLVIVIVIAALALVTASFTTSPRNSESYQDYAQRHWAELSASRDPDSTDFFVRHPELTMTTYTALPASDYFMRHPELSTLRLVDTTDYFFRQAAQ